MRRYIGVDIRAKSRAASTTADNSEEVTMAAVTPKVPVENHTVPFSHTTPPDVTECRALDPVLIGEGP